MDTITRTNLENLHSPDHDVQNKAFFSVLAATDGPIDWAYEVWDEMVAGLKHSDNHIRSISAQVLSNLSRSDPDKRILKDFDALLNVTRDERFVTARHCLPPGYAGCATISGTWFCSRYATAPLACSWCAPSMSPWSAVRMTIVRSATPVASRSSSSAAMLRSTSRRQFR